MIEAAPATLVREYSPEQVSILQCRDEFQAICGGFASGKSFATWDTVCLDAINSPPDRHLLGMPTGNQMARTMVREVKAALDDMRVRWSWNGSLRELSLPNGAVMVFHTLNVNHPGVLKGGSASTVTVDEADNVKPEVLDMLLSRLRGSGLGIARVLFNPVPTQHWLWQKLLAEKWTVLQSTTYSNGALRDSAIKRYERLYPPHTPQWRRYMLGSPGVALEGAVYPEFGPDCMVDGVPTDAQGRPLASVYVAGLDFGASNPTALIQAVYTETDRIVIVGEHYAANLLCRDHVTMAADAGVLRADQTIFADHANRQERLEWEALGYPTMPADKSVRAGIEAVRKRLRNGTLLIQRGVAPNLERELAEYVWAPATAGQAEERPVKVNDHACFTPGTLVRMADGQAKPIRAVAVGDVVATPEGPQPVLGAGRTRLGADVVRVRYSSGAQTVATPDHLFSLGASFAPAVAHDGAGWRPLPHDLELAGGGWARPVDCEAAGQSDVWCLSVACGAFVLSNGLVAKNCDALRYLVMGIESAQASWQPTRQSLEIMR